LHHYIGSKFSKLGSLFYINAIRKLTCLYVQKILAFLEGWLLSSQLEQFKNSVKALIDWKKAGSPNKSLVFWTRKQDKYTVDQQYLKRINKLEGKICYYIVKCNQMRRWSVAPVFSSSNVEKFIFVPIDFA